MRRQVVVVLVVLLLAAQACARNLLPLFRPNGQSLGPGLARQGGPVPAQGPVAQGPQGQEQLLRGIKVLANAVAGAIMNNQQGLPQGPMQPEARAEEAPPPAEAGPGVVPASPPGGAPPVGVQPLPQVEPLVVNQVSTPVPVVQMGDRAGPPLVPKDQQPVAQVDKEPIVKVGKGPPKGPMSPQPVAGPLPSAKPAIGKQHRGHHKVGPPIPTAHHGLAAVAPHTGGKAAPALPIVDAPSEEASAELAAEESSSKKTPPPTSEATEEEAKTTTHRPLTVLAVPSSGFHGGRAPMERINAGVPRSGPGEEEQGNVEPDDAGDENGAADDEKEPEEPQWGVQVPEPGSAVDEIENAEPAEGADPGEGTVLAIDNSDGGGVPDGVVIDEDYQELPGGEERANQDQRVEATLEMGIRNPGKFELVIFNELNTHFEKYKKHLFEIRNATKRFKRKRSGVIPKLLKNVQALLTLSVKKVGPQVTSIGHDAYSLAFFSGVKKIDQNKTEDDDRKKQPRDSLLTALSEFERSVSKLRFVLIWLKWNHELIRLTEGKIPQVADKLESLNKAVGTIEVLRKKGGLIRRLEHHIAKQVKAVIIGNWGVITDKARPLIGVCKGRLTKGTVGGGDEDAVAEEEHDAQDEEADEEQDEKEDENEVTSGSDTDNFDDEYKGNDNDNSDSTDGTDDTDGGDDDTDGSGKGTDSTDETDGDTDNTDVSEEEPDPDEEKEVARTLRAKERQEEYLRAQQEDEQKQDVDDENEDKVEENEAESEENEEADFEENEEAADENEEQFEENEEKDEDKVEEGEGNEANFDEDIGKDEDVENEDEEIENQDKDLDEVDEESEDQDEGLDEEDEDKENQDEGLDEEDEAKDEENEEPDEAQDDENEENKKDEEEEGDGFGRKTLGLKRRENS